MSAVHEEVIRVLTAAAPHKLKSAEIYERGNFDSQQVLAMALYDMAGTLLTRDGDRGKFQYGFRDGVDPQQWLRNRKTRAKPDPAKQPGPVRIVRTVADLGVSLQNDESVNRISVQKAGFVNQTGSSKPAALAPTAAAVVIPRSSEAQGPAANERATMPMKAVAPAPSIDAAHHIRQLWSGAIDDLVECAESHADENIKKLAHRVRLLEELRDTFAGSPA